MAGEKRNKKAAAALKYDEKKGGAPKVVAAGYGDIAKKIEELALKEDIPVCRDKALAEALADLGIGTEIPPELYQAVAKIIAAVARLDLAAAKKP